MIRIIDQWVLRFATCVVEFELTEVACQQWVPMTQRHIGMEREVYTAHGDSNDTGNGSTMNPGCTKIMISIQINFAIHAINYGSERNGPVALR